MEVNICNFLFYFTNWSELWEMKDSSYTDNGTCASGNSLGGMNCAPQRAGSSQSFTSADKTMLIEQLAGIKRSLETLGPLAAPWLRSIEYEAENTNIQHLKRIGIK